MGDNVVMELVELWRYPVKGLLGERLNRCVFDERGIEGDRWWAIVGADGKLASGKTTRRFRRMPNLFAMSARTTEDGDVLVRIENWEGSVHDPVTAMRVSEVVAEPVTLRPEAVTRHHDEGGVHIVTTASLRFLNGIDRRRLRPNLVLDADGDEPLEDGWPGKTLSLGEVRFRVTSRMPRCVMATLAQADLPFDPRIMKVIEDRNGGCLGIVAEVATPGAAAKGDPGQLVG